MAKTRDGRPVVLFRTPTDTPETAPPASRMASIATSFAKTARLKGLDGRTEESTFAAVELLGGDSTLYPVFLDALQAVGDQVPDAITGAKLAPLLDRVFLMFKALGAAPKTTALGAWGELLAILESNDADHYVACWHAHPEDLVDFASSVGWLEVKATTGELPQHQVTLRQISPPPGIAGTLVSIQTVAASGGLSLRELATRVKTKLSPPMRAKLEETLAAQLGRDHAVAMETAFDERMGKTSLRRIRMQDVPRVPQPLPAMVTAVQFTTDVSQSPLVQSPSGLL
ncbi:MAG: PD-(D/E)XK motif protein [Candidatus Thermoplasmatota archaeon]